MMYRPLPDGLHIAVSTIEGQGLHTYQLIPAGTDLGVARLVVGGEVVRTPLGGFVNHADVPNCRMICNGLGCHLMTLRDIRPGEELTVAYTLYQIGDNDGD